MSKIREFSEHYEREKKYLVNNCHKLDKKIAKSFLFKKDRAIFLL